MWYNEPSGIGGLLQGLASEALGYGSPLGDLGTTDVSFWDMMGDDWSLPVGSETGDDFTVGDMTSGDDWLSDFWGGMGDDWSIPVGSETGDPITAGDITYGDDWLSDFWSDMGSGDQGEDWRGSLPG